MPPHFTPEGYYRGPSNQDGSGHGSHLTTLALSAKRSPDGKYNGIAPGADLVSITAFDRFGQATYISIIQAIQFAVDHKDTYGIRVLNCSFSAPPRSHYWDDPLNQAIMAAWQAGIVVVTSAGNAGPDGMTIGVPGNTPYVITVGAMSDAYTPEDPTDDYLTSFSSAGPTVEGFVKPELVAPGGHVRAQMSWVSELGEGHREYRDTYPYFEMSGTSQSTAVVSGVVALMLQDKPWLTPDQVKYRLMAAARPAVDANGQLGYSIFQQGAGMVDAYAAVMNEPSDPQAAANGAWMWARTWLTSSTTVAGRTATSSGTTTSKASTAISGATVIRGPTPSCGATPSCRAMT